MRCSGAFHTNTLPSSRPAYLNNSYSMSPFFPTMGLNCFPTRYTRVVGIPTTFRARRVESPVLLGQGRTRHAMTARVERGSTTLWTPTSWLTLPRVSLSARTTARERPAASGGGGFSLFSCSTVEVASERCTPLSSHSHRTTSYIECSRR